jgi:hypothetical protein
LGAVTEALEQRRVLELVGPFEAVRGPVYYPPLGVLAK